MCDMWDGMYQMSLNNNHLGGVAVERHSSLPEINEFVELKEKERMFERRNSFTAIPNTKKKIKGQRRRCQRSGSTRSVDSGYITQTILNEQIAWSQEEVNFSSKATAVNCKKKTISLRNSIQALLDANDNLVTDSYKTLNDAEEWSKSHDAKSHAGLLNGNAGSLSMLEQIGRCVNQTDDMMSSLLRQTTYSSVDQHESEMLEYSYTIDAELSYQEYNKLMQIIIMILQEKKKWEEYIKDAEVKLAHTKNEKSELANNNKVLKESLEGANAAMNDINSKVQKMKESLGHLREENNSLRRENKELKDKMKAFESETKLADNDSADEAKESWEEMSAPEKELIEYKRSMQEKFNKLEEAYRSYRKEMETKHADMNGTLEEANQLYDSATCNIEELKNEILTLTNWTDTLTAKNEELTAEIKDKQEEVDTLAATNETLTVETKERQEEVNTLAAKYEKLTVEINEKREEVDALAVKNEKLTGEIKEKIEEADKKLISETIAAQIRNERAKEVEDDYKKQLQDTNEEIEKQKWEVFFYKEESTSLEKENNQLKSNAAELESKMKDVEGKYEALEKEAEQEMQRNRLLKGELEVVKRELDELRDIKRKHIEVNLEVEVYKRQASTHQILRNELESLKRDNLSQISENENLKAQVEKLKIDAIETTTPQPRPEMETKRLFKEMENLRNQLHVLDGNQDTATADCNETKVELEKMRKELNTFLENVQKQSKEKEARTIKEDISELKLQMSELEYLSRSKVINCVIDSETSSSANESGKSNEFSDFKYVGEKEHGAEDVKKVRPKIQLVIHDDVVKWIDAPKEYKAKEETKLEVEDTKFQDLNGHTEEKQLEMLVSNPKTDISGSANMDANRHPLDTKNITEDDNKERAVKESVVPNMESVVEINDEELEQKETELLPHPKDMVNDHDETDTFPRVEIIKHSRMPDVDRVSCGGGEKLSEQGVEIFIRSPTTSIREASICSTRLNRKVSAYPNTEKYSSIPHLQESPSLKGGLCVAYGMNHRNDGCQTTHDSNDPFNHVTSNKSQADSQAMSNDDHIYAVVANGQRGGNVPTQKKVYGNCNSLRGRTTSAYSSKKGLSRTNTYLCSDYHRHVNKGHGYEGDIRGGKIVNQAVDGRRGHSKVQKLKAISTEGVLQSSPRASPVKTKLSRTIASLSSHDNMSNQKYNHVSTSTEGEWKPALPVRNTSLRLMSKKKPNELFQDQKSRAMIREERAECVDRESAYSRHDSRVSQAVRKPVTLKRAQSVKVKGEELYASIRKRTADETKEKFIERMNSINDVERLQIERMESARQKLTGKALQEEVTSRNNTIKKKSLQSKSTSNPTASSTVQSKAAKTASITIHGIPVRRNARRNSEYENEVADPTSRRHSADVTTKEKNSSSKLRRAASLSKKSALAGEFKHLKDGIKSQLLKSKGYPQKTFEFFTEEAMKKYKYARDTLKTRNFCLKSENAMNSPLRRPNDDGCSAAKSHAEDVLKEIRDMTAGYEPIKAKPETFNAKPNERLLSADNVYSAGCTKREAIYENAPTYNNSNTASDPVIRKENNTSPKNRFSLSDADLTSLSREEGGMEDQMSWEHYYPVGETTPKNSLLSLV